MPELRAEAPAALEPKLGSRGRTTLLQNYQPWVPGCVAMLVEFPMLHSVVVHVHVGTSEGNRGAHFSGDLDFGTGG